MTSFDSFYADVPADQRELLREFRLTHPSKQTVINGTTWDYITCGQGEGAILWLVGGLRVADAAYRSIPLMEESFRIIAPTYPALTTMNALCDGLAGLLDAESIDQVHVLAGSFGGMVAQAFVRRHPNRVRTVVLSTTAALDSEAAERYRQQAAMITAASAEVVAQVSKSNFVKMIDPPEAEYAFWEAYVDELFTERLGKDDLLSTITCLLDFAENHRLTPDDLKDWPGQVLIIESADDATFDAAARAQLKALYPTAQIHTFEAGGHSPATTRRHEYFGLVRDFMTKYQ